MRTWTSWEAMIWPATTHGRGEQLIGIQGLQDGALLPGQAQGAGLCQEPQRGAGKGRWAAEGDGGEKARH